MKFNYKTRKTLKNVLSILLCGLVIFAAAFGVSALSSKLKDDTKVIHPSFSVGGIDSNGSGNKKSTASVYTKEAFEAKGLSVKLDFDANVKYQAFFYDDLDNYISCSDIYTASSDVDLPAGATHARLVVKALNRIEKRYGKQFKQIFKTITVDNGTEFSNCQGIEKSMYGKGQRTKVYYCHPYSSWERGSNERINREIRRLIPKGTNLANVTEAQIRYVEEWVNNYPREIFDFETSNERFARELAKIA